MTKSEILQAQSIDEIRSCYQVLCQLRPHLTDEQAFVDQVHLDSGPQRHDAHRLYLNHGFKIIGHHLALNLKDSL